MRQGLESTEWTAKQDVKTLHHIFKGIYYAKAISPDCPDKSKIFLRVDSMAKTKTVCEQKKPYKLCDINISAICRWDNDSLQIIEDRLKEIKAFGEAAAEDDLKAPDNFKERGHRLL